MPSSEIWGLGAEGRGLGGPGALARAKEGEREGESFARGGGGGKKDTCFFFDLRVSELESHEF